MKQPTPYILPNEMTIESVLNSCRKSGFFDDEEVEWLESVLTRRDGQPGADQLRALIDFVRAERTAGDEWNDYKAKQQARALLWSAQVSFYRQRHVLVCVPQRKQHAKYPIPNGTNIRAVQSMRISLTTCYGLGFAESRVHLAKQALADQSVTHVLFLDDDILIPQDAIAKLVAANLPLVAGMYTKKNPTLESVVTTIAPDKGYIYGQHMVQPTQTPSEPVPSSACGAGFLLVEVNTFKRLPEPWFQFVHAADGSVVIGEDSYFIQKATSLGMPTFVLPDVCGVHVDFATGEHFGPEWLVDPVKRKIRPEYAPHYTSFPADLDVKELLAHDIVDVFGRNKDIKLKSA